MKAGRELDKLIGEKILQLDGWYLADEFLPRFSTNIEAAWLVVEKLKSMGGEIAIRVSPLGIEVETSEELEQGTSAPYLICITALKECGFDI